MANLALIYPEISRHDYQKIQKIRQQHDRRYFNVVDPHVTLVFGTDKVNADELTEHVRAILNEYKAFRLTFDSAKIVEDDSKDFYHAFLIPSAGFDEINDIHDRLYTGVLASELRHDIPFIPHLGIGTGSKLEMTQLVDELNEKQLKITGTADIISIVQYDGIKVGTHSQIPLS